MEYEIRRLWIDRDPRQKQLWQNLLQSSGIRAEAAISYCAGLFFEDQLVATGSLYQNIIKCVAVSPAHQGGKAVSILLSHLLSTVMENGSSSCYVYTKPQAARSFEELGFRELARVDDQLVFMERAIYGFPQYLKDLERQRVPGQAAGIVMNANPFTLGHRYLAERAARENETLHLFVLSEELSAFPAATRLELVRRGVQHLPNVRVHPTGDYMVSAKTFPSYFLKEDVQVAKVQATLDAILFRDHIAPAAGITRRYVGEEPLSPVTQLYNESMKEVFHGAIDLVILPRIEQGGNVISASRVRDLLRRGKTEETKELVPESTYAYLISPEGKALIQKLQQEG